MSAVKLTGRRRERLLAALESGASVAEAARRVGVSRQRVAQVARAGRFDLAAGRATADAEFARAYDAARRGGVAELVGDSELPPTLDAFVEFCSGLTLDEGRPMVLEPFQRAILADYFAGARETVALLPKGNGKTTTLAALALFELVARPDAEIVIAAAARDQAAIMLRQATGFIRRSGPLGERLTVLQREIAHRQLGGRVRVLSADERTADGVIPTAAFVDELHRHRSGELFAVLRHALEKRAGRLVCISTAGDDQTSPLGQLRTAAYRLPEQHRDGAYRCCRSADGSFVMHEWALDPDQDLDDLALVKSANPASWVTVERLRERHDSPSTTRWGWARFACGVWLRGDGAAIEAADWDALADPFVSIPPSSPVYVGLDLGWRGDATAIVPVWVERRDRRVIGNPVVLEPPEGGTLDDRLVVEALIVLRDRFRVVAVVYDPAAAFALAQQLEREGLPMVEHSQRDSSMALADGRFLEAIRRRELVHSGHPVLREHVLNAVEKPIAGERFRFVRPRHGPRVPIDCLTAASMAHSVAVAEASAAVDRSVYFLA